MTKGIDNEFHLSYIVPHAPLHSLHALIVGRPIAGRRLQMLWGARRLLVLSKFIDLHRGIRFGLTYAFAWHQTSAGSCGSARSARFNRRPIARASCSDCRARPGRIEFAGLSHATAKHWKPGA